MSHRHEVVVGAVIVDGGRVLAARRSRPADLAGHWEFPGGKVEPGEDARTALGRELLEELAVTVGVGDELEGGPWPISERYVLRLFLASLGNGAVHPGPDHDELRWLAAGELESVDWLPSDRDALDAVRAVLDS